MKEQKGDVEKALEEIFGETLKEEDKVTPNTSFESSLVTTDVEDKTDFVKFEDGKDDVYIAKFEDNDKNKIDDSKLLESDTKKSLDLTNSVETSKEEPKLNDSNADKQIEVKTKVNKSDNNLFVSKKLYTKPKFKYNKFFIIGFILLFVIITIFALYKTNKEVIVSCTSVIKDEGYKVTDEYVIAHKSGNLTYVQGTYVYNAYNDEYKKQIEAIKEEKLMVILNSNGMPGFTHVYEISDDYIKVNSYYDITKMNFKKVDKNNDEIAPISFVKIKSNTTFDSLSKSLKKEGYKCVRSN